jgi:hypothetical protein
MPALSTVLTPRPVSGLRAERREKEVLVTFEWPDTAETAVVDWRAGRGRGREPLVGRASPSRRSYTHEGAVTLRVGLGEVEIQVSAMVPTAYPESGAETASRALVPALRSIARYLPELAGRRRPAARITVTCEDGCALPEIAVVLGTTVHRPVRIGDGDVVHRIPAHPVRAGVPDVTEFPIGRLSAPSWLVCFAVDQGPDDADVVPLSLSRLKVR